jgi:hypothetical protein
LDPVDELREGCSVSENKTRRQPIYGPEVWAEVDGRPWSHWDRWYCVVCVADFAGDWDALAERLATRSGRLHIASDAESKLSHLDDLVGRLRAAGLGVADLAGDVERTELTKARRKVLDQGLSGRDRTPAMRDTPTRRLRTRALRGAWRDFPVDPADTYELFVSFVDEADHIGKGRTFELARVLDEQIAAAADAAGGDSGRLLASRRAALTAVQEIAHRVDDSYGQIGELGQAAWSAYASTRWRDLIPEAVYWRDVAQLVAFDDYAHLHRAETLPWRQARAADLPLLRSIVAVLTEEYAAARLDYHAQQARVALAWAHLATRSLRRYADVARDLGSEHWMPVVALAESALRAHRPDVAAAVFDAADQPGSHREYLRRRRRELLHASTSPNLRIVNQE